MTQISWSKMWKPYLFSNSNISDSSSCCKLNFSLLSKDSAAKPDDIVKFYEKHSAPLVGHIQSHTEKRFTKRPLVVVYYDVNFSHEYASSKSHYCLLHLQSAKRHFQRHIGRIFQKNLQGDLMATSFRVGN